ncbi:hypothetical protein KR76_03310 [Pimelobacter simplex]|uniref:Secreted protein n=1 Tax=Nocardioides simplex TaxID=2045 RepID=A0A0A1DHP5_NOCSI|nr:hypothetical protein KR76_03310 [Pimelobacter simplex]
MLLVAVALTTSVLVVAGGGDSRAATPSHLPGVFAVAIKGEVAGTTGADRRQLGRLALYDFRADGTVTERYWAWNTATDTPASAWGSSSNNYCITYVGVPTGGTPQPDSSSAPLCRVEFHDNINTPALEGEPSSLTGTYTNVTSPGVAPVDGDVIQVTWAGGAGVERWRYAFSNDKIAKIEMIYFDKFQAPNDFYAAQPTYALRDQQAVNAGWGWGAAGTTLKGGLGTEAIRDEVVSQGPAITGCQKFWNNFYGNPVRSNTQVNNPTECGEIISLGSYTLTTATWPKLRYVTGLPCVNGGAVYRYFSALDANTQVASVTDRRIQSVVEHDFNCNGRISDNFGHTQMGLQIIDADGRFAGVVMIQDQYNGNPAPLNYDSIGASYFVTRSVNEADPTVR